MKKLLVGCLFFFLILLFYSSQQVGNSAWKQFLRTNLGFTAGRLNMLLMSAYILLYAGVVTYKYFMINWSWQKATPFRCLTGK